MKKFLPLLILAISAAVSLHAQTYAIGQSICSKGAGIYCYGIPLNLAGQPQANVWLNVQPTYDAAWLFFGEGLANLGQAQINQDASYQPVYGVVTNNGHTATQMTSLSLTYYGTASSGSAYSGAMTISFDYYYVSTCSGRGCGGTLGWHRRVTGGSTTFAIANYAPIHDSPIAPTPTCLPGDPGCRSRD